MTTLFIEADEPLLVFPSIDAARRYLEPEDVRNGVYPNAYGPNGETFVIVVEGERVTILPSGDPPDPEGLSRYLRRSLAAVGEPFGEDAPLHTLVGAAEAFWAERDPYGERFSIVLPTWGCVLIIAALIGLVAYFWW